MAIETINNIDEISNWKNNILEIERKKEQTVKKNSHTNNVNETDYNYHSNSGHSNYTPHSDYTYHSNYNGYSQSNPHSNRNSYHSNNHTNYTQAHANYSGPHVNDYSQSAHQDYPGPHKNSGSGNNHHNYNGHYNAGHRNGHQNGGHANKDGYHNQSGYSQSNPHSNIDSYHYNSSRSSRPHSNSSGYHTDNHYNNANVHRNYSTHNNSGFDHINYIPSTPYIYDDKMNDVLTLSGTKDIFFYSYDKNNDGEGSQFNYSKEVYYKVEIRQIKDLNGNSKISSWKTVQDFSMAESYRINTIDPLKTGNTNHLNTEGYYEIRVTPQNNSYGGVTFVGQPIVKEVKIQQNAMPTIVVDNPEEFLSFSFGIDGVVNKENQFIEYPNMEYKESKKDNFRGLFINITVSDDDIEDYLKGEVKLKGNGSLIASSPIIWDNGSEVIKSEKKLRNGYIYISKDDLLNNFDNTSFKNAAIEIYVRNYFDESGNLPKGDYVISRKVNMSSGEELFINIDKVAPKMSSISGLDTVGKTTTIKLNAADDISGVKSITLPNGVIVNNSSVSYTVDRNGLYSFILTDKVGNNTIYIAEVTGVDTTKPTVNIINNQNWTNQNVQVDITAEDK